MLATVREIAPVACNAKHRAREEEGARDGDESETKEWCEEGEGAREGGKGVWRYRHVTWSVYRNRVVGSHVQP